MDNFLLIVNSAESIDGKNISAYEMAKRRLAALQWALYINTPHRKIIQKEDRVIVYLAGTQLHGMSFVATAIVHGKDKAEKYIGDGQDVLAGIPHEYIQLKNLMWFENFVRIHSIKDSLDFIPKKTNRWGAVMQRGVKKISEEDALKILAASSVQV
jgi:hypothetical protein